MDSVLKIRDLQIDELMDRIEFLKEDFKNTLIEIAKSKKVIDDSNTRIDEISDEQIKNEKFNWKGIHLYGGVEVPRFEFGNIMPNSELMYEMKNFDFGLKAQLQPIGLKSGSDYQFNYLLKLRYKIF